MDKDRQNFLEDTEKRRQAIYSLRPNLLFGFVTEELWHCSRAFFPNDMATEEDDNCILPAIYDMLRAFDCYKASIKKSQLSLVPQTDFNLWRFHLAMLFGKQGSIMMRSVLIYWRSHYHRNFKIIYDLPCPYSPILQSSRYLFCLMKATRN